MAVTVLHDQVAAEAFCILVVFWKEREKNSLIWAHNNNDDDDNNDDDEEEDNNNNNAYNDNDDYNIVKATTAAATRKTMIIWKWKVQQQCIKFVVTVYSLYYEVPRTC